MKSKLFYYLLLFFLLIREINIAQVPGWQWANTIGAGSVYETCYDVAIDASGNIYIAGSFYLLPVDFDPGPGTFNLTPVWNDDAFIAKYDGAGNFIWAKQFGGVNYEYVNSIKVSPAGDLYATGIFTGTIDFDPGPSVFNLTPTPAGTQNIFILKLDNAGNFVWAITMDAYQSVAIAFDDSGNVYTTGYFSNTTDFDPGPGTFNLTSAGNFDVFISKLDSLGNFVWAKSIGGSGQDKSGSIALDGSGNVYITGSFKSAGDFDPGLGTFILTYVGPEANMFISKLNNSGNFVWAKGIHTTWGVGSSSLVIDANNNVYTAGSFLDFGDFDPGPGIYNLQSYNSLPGCFISKFDSSGNFTFAKAIANINGGTGIEIALDSSQNKYLIGTFSGTFSVDLDPGPGYFPLWPVGSGNFVSKFDSTDNFVWAKAYGGGVPAVVSASMAVDGAGNVAVAGAFMNASFNFDSIHLTNKDLTGNSADIFFVKLGNGIMGIGNANNKNNGRIWIYPNPATKNFTIKSDGIDKKAKVIITDIAGKRIFYAIWDESQKLIINTNDLSTGIYFISIKGDDFIQTQKLMIVK